MINHFFLQHALQRLQHLPTTDAIFESKVPAAFSAALSLGAVSQVKLISINLNNKTSSAALSRAAVLQVNRMLELLTLLSNSNPSFLHSSLTLNSLFPDSAHVAFPNREGENTSAGGAGGRAHGARRLPGPREAEAHFSLCFYCW